MAKSDGKFLYNLVHSLTDRQLLLLVWGIIVGIFVILMIRYYKKRTRRNFRTPEDGPAMKVRVDSRRLVGERNLPTATTSRNIRPKT